MLLLTASFDLDGSRLNSADADFEATLGSHKSGLALLQLLGFDALLDEASDEGAPAAGATTTIQPATTGDGAASAPAAGAVPATIDTPSTGGASTDDAAAAPTETVAQGPGGDAPSRRPTIYAFKGRSELKSVVPRLVTMLLDIGEGPMPPKPSEAEVAADTRKPSDRGTAAEEAEDESGLSDEEKKTRSLLRQCVPTRFTPVDFEGAGMDMIGDAFLTKLTNHPGTVIGLAKQLCSSNVKEAVARLLAKMAMITPIFTGLEGSRPARLLEMTHGEAVALQALHRMAPDMAAVCLLSRWTTCLFSKALTATELVNEIMRRHGPRLRSTIGSDVASKLFLGMKTLPFIPPPAPYAKVEGLPELDMEQVQAEARKAALRGLEVADSDVAVNVVDLEAHTSTTRPDVIDAVVLQSHEHDIATRLKALQAV